jgi:5'-nucleotidase
MDLLVESGVTHEVLRSCVNEMMETNIPELRNGAVEFLKLLHACHVPLVILSAGLQDLITEFLKQKKIKYDNIHVVANRFVFDKNGKAIDSEQGIHVLNKNEARLHDLPIYKEIKKRKNVILLGDSLGDLKMVGGFAYDCLLKIGFLNDRVEENLEEYKRQFDVIIPGDGGFDFVNELLREMCG